MLKMRCHNEGLMAWQATNFHNLVTYKNLCIFQILSPTHRAAHVQN